MASSLHICLSFLALFFFFFDLSYGASTSPMPIILPIRKDNATNQYYTEIDIGTSLAITYLVLDLGGQFLWFDCESGYYSAAYKAISCGSTKCKQAKGSGCLGCNLTPRPGCTNNTCGMSPYNPISNILVAEGLGEDVIQVATTDGKVSLLTVDVPHFPLSCVHTFQLEGLANITKGMLGLARTRTALHTQLAQTLKLPHKFALCIPSSHVNGFGSIFLGGGVYNFPPYGDVSKVLTTTPLVINPVSTAAVYSQGEASDEYFIKVTSIKVGVKLVKFDTSLLSFDKKGVGGTKISTMTPYTILHATIYKRLLKEFVKQASTRKMTRVASVAPFGACFSSKSVGSTMTGPNVPNIDLVLQSESVYWRIYGANSMVEVKNGDVMCLGVIDGGAEPRTSIVIGGHQLEDNLVEFDLKSSKLGFTSLLLKNSTCSQSRIF